MLRRSLVVLSTLLSFSALANVSFEEKQGRVEFLHKLGMEGTFAIEAYKRELQYERLNLSHRIRAKREANLLAEKIKSQIALAYEAAIKEHGDVELARQELKQAIAKDLRLAAPELKNEVSDLANQFLSNMDQGSLSSQAELNDVESYLLSGIRDRSVFLNEGGEDPRNKSFVYDPSAMRKANFEKREYGAKDELVAALFNDQESARWVSTTNMTVRSIEQKKTEKKISLQVKINFLGGSVELGPFINFKREFSTNANVMAEGLDPILFGDGNFDFWKRDKTGKITIMNGKLVKRFISFYCDADLNFESEYTGAGGFKVGVSSPGASVALGPDISFTKKYTSSVNLSSRRVMVPEYVEGESVTLKFLADICHHDFLNGKFNNKLTVASSLELMMRSVVSGLEFSHPRTKCVTDETCFGWFNQNIAMARIKTFPRCIEDTKEKFRSCVLRGLKGQNCAVIKDGKRISDGTFEFVCDKGLKCVQTQEAGFFKDGNLYQSAKGQCLPVNKRTYHSPLNTNSYLTIRFQ